MARLTYTRVPVAGDVGAATKPSADIGPRAVTDTVGVSTTPETTSPRAPFTVTTVLSCRSRVAVRAPTTQGTPSSRATMAA